MGRHPREVVIVFAAFAVPHRCPSADGGSARRLAGLPAGRSTSSGRKIYGCPLAHHADPMGR
jgi:hypothetical protein